MNRPRRHIHQARNAVSWMPRGKIAGEGFASPISPEINTSWKHADSPSRRNFLRCNHGHPLVTIPMERPRRASRQGIASGNNRRAPLVGLGIAGKATSHKSIAQIGASKRRPHTSMSLPNPRHRIQFPHPPPWPYRTRTPENPTRSARSPRRNHGTIPPAHPPPPPDDQPTSHPNQTGRRHTLHQPTNDAMHPSSTPLAQIHLNSTIKVECYSARHKTRSRAFPAGQTSRHREPCKIIYTTYQMDLF